MTMYTCFAFEPADDKSLRILWVACKALEIGEEAA
jgi:hypothetical protein